MRYQEIRKEILRLDVGAELDRLGLTYEIRGHEAVLGCPFHDHVNPTLGVVVSGAKKGLWRCRNPECGESGHFLRLIRKVLGYTNEQALRHLGISITLGKEELERILFELEMEMAAFAAGERGPSLSSPGRKASATPFSFPESFPDHPTMRRYLAGRGFLDPEDTVRTHGLRYGREMPWRERILIPIYDRKGVLRSVAGRSTNPDQVKMLFPHGAPIDSLLLGIHRAAPKEDLVLVEGPMDYLKLSSLGISGVISPLSAHLSLRQQKLLREIEPKTLSIAFDGDFAGRVAAVMIGRQLAALVSVRIVWFPNDRDPGDLLRSETFQSLPRLSVEEAGLQLVLQSGGRKLPKNFL